MDRNYVKQIIGNKRYKLATNTNTNLQLHLEEKTKPLTEYDLIDIVNLQNLFEDERAKATNYRFNGKLNIYTSNVLSTGATSSTWDPLFYGTPAVAPNNWVMQMTYPSSMDFNYPIQARTSSGSISTNAYRGLQYEALGNTIVNGDTKLTVVGIQRHNLSAGEFIYLYSNLSYNPLQGIHQIGTLGINGDNTKTDITLDTIINSTPAGMGNFVRLVDVSFNDINFDNPSLINIMTTTDISGNTTGSFSPGETIYTTVTSTTPHDLLINDFVDIRTGSVNILNGVWRVYNIISTTKFVIRLASSLIKGTNINFSTPLPNWRRLDATPSEYYTRNFEVLTSNDYDVYKCAFSVNTYSDVSDPTLSTANDIWSFQFNQDVSVKRIRDNRNGPISEMYYTLTKRSGQNPYNWSHVTADWDFNFETSDTSNGLEWISVNTPSNIGTIEKYSAMTETIDSNGEVVVISGSKYIGDFIEYNSKEIQEITIAEIIHRFGLNSNPNGEGYYYKPFKKLQLRKYSTVIETAAADELIIDVPENFVTYADGSIAWRDLLTIGYFEEEVNGVDYPFVNGVHYFYFNHNLFIRRQLPPVLIDQTDVKVKINLEEKC
jgi:hypothetical protein